MCQPRGAVAGGMVLDLDNSSVMAVECEDRRYCFQITSPSGKTYAHIFTYNIYTQTCKRYLEVFNWILSIVVYAPRSMILQAESKREYEEVSVNEAV